MDYLRKVKSFCALVWDLLTATAPRIYVNVSAVWIFQISYCEPITVYNGAPRKTDTSLRAYEKKKGLVRCAGTAASVRAQGDEKFLCPVFEISRRRRSTDGQRRCVPGMQRGERLLRHDELR